MAEGKTFHRARKQRQNFTHLNLEGSQLADNESSTHWYKNGSSRKVEVLNVIRFMNTE